MTKMFCIKFNMLIFKYLFKENQPLELLSGCAIFVSSNFIQSVLNSYIEVKTVQVPPSFEIKAKFRKILPFLKLVILQPAMPLFAERSRTAEPVLLDNATLVLHDNVIITSV